MLSKQVAKLINGQINQESLLATLEHGKSVIASINNTYAVAFENKEFRTTQFLECFIKEQGEEEKSTKGSIKKYGVFREDGKGIYLLNHELVARVYMPSSLVI